MTQTKTWTRRTIKPYKGQLVRLKHKSNKDKNCLLDYTGIIEAAVNRYIVFNVNNEGIEKLIEYSNIISVRKFTRKQDLEKQKKPD